MEDTEITALEFEKNIAEVEEKIKRLKQLELNDGININTEVSRLQQKLERLFKQLYAKLTPWQKTLVARHPSRPHCLDYINGLIEDFEPLCGDRAFADDMAMVMLKEWCDEHRPELSRLFTLVQEYRKWGKIKSTIKDSLSEFVWKKTKRRPMILPIIMEVE